jgi:hypothetical protein
MQVITLGEKENMKRLASVILLFTLGCASIVHQTTQEVPVKSDPAGAAVTVACGDVHNDPKLVTPTVVTVHRKPDHCVIGLTRDGYQPAEVVLRKSVSGWYVANLLIGGIIGFVVDAANGAMWNRSPAEIDVKLQEPSKPSNTPNSN